MNFLQQILDTFSKGSKYDALFTQYNELLKSFEQLEKVLVTERRMFTETITTLENENTLLHSDLQDKREGTLKPITDAFSTDKYYALLKKKMPSGAFKYPFRGDGEDLDIKYSLIVKDETLVKKYGDLIDKKYKIDSPLKAVEAVMEYFIYDNTPKYISDQQLFKKRDYWESTETFLKNWKGDCDGTAIAMHSLIRYLLYKKGYEKHYNRLLLHINDNYLEGHANNLWMHDDGFFYTVESTIDLKGTYKRKWLKVPLAYDSFYKKTRGIANLNGSFKGVNALYDNYKGE